MRRHVFIHNINKHDDFENVIYFDIETVENIKDVETFDKTVSLNVLNAKYVVAGTFKELKFDKNTYKEFREDKKDDVYMYYNVEKTGYERIRDFLLHLADVNNIRTFIAFNGMRFDFLVFKGFKVREFNRCIALLYANRKTYKLVDIICLARAMGKNSLSEFVKTENLQKVYYDDIIEYCKNDVYTLAKTCRSFQNVYNYTPTRTSRMFLADWLKNKKIVSYCNDAFDYVGGRVSVFTYNVDNTVYHYDINSLYPYTMYKLKHPVMIERDNDFKIPLQTADDKEEIKRYINMLTRFYDYRKNVYHNVSILNNVLDVYLFLRVKIKDVKQNYYDVFPYSFLNERKQRVFAFQPDGEYWVYGYEVVFLKFFEYEILECYYTGADFLPFSNEILKLYKKRLELKKLNDKTELLYKIVLNSSYGVFGKREDRKKYMLIDEDIEKIKLFAKEHNIDIDTLGDIYDDIIDNKRIEFVRADYNILKITYVNKKFSTLSAPLLALSITSNARFILHTLIYNLKSNSYDVYYCDTDSVFTNADMLFMYKNMYLSDEIGKLKHEGTYKKALFLAPKTYITDKPKMKGTGTELEKEIVMQSFKTDFKIITRRFIDIESIPAFIPVNNKPVLNTDKIKVKDSHEYMNLIREFETLYEARIKQAQN